MLSKNIYFLKQQGLLICGIQFAAARTSYS